MRVIAGKCRSIPLKTLEGDDVTRPTSDRYKETLFNVIQFDIEGEKFLDLFAGSGQMGIEALSRGASHAFFVERDKKAAQIIRDNLHKTKLEDDATLINRELPAALSLLIKDGPFHIIFMDPPYKDHKEDSILKEIKEDGLCDNDSIIIIESEKDRDFSSVEKLGFEVTKEKIYKTNKHVFLRLK